MKLLSLNNISSKNNSIIQLCFIISDARLDSDNRLELQTIINFIREILEQYILVVLIILDLSKNNNDSI